MSTFYTNVYPFYNNRKKMEKYVCPHQIPGCPDQIHKPLPMYVIMIGAADLDKQLRKEIARIVGFIPNTEWQLDFLHNLDFHKFWKIASWIHNIFCNSQWCPQNVLSKNKRKHK